MEQKEIGIGYFSTLKNPAEKNYYFDFFAGSGQGHGNFTSEYFGHKLEDSSGYSRNYSDSVSSNSKFRKFYIQSDMYQKNKIATWGIGSRLVFIDFYSFDYIEKNDGILSNDKPSPYGLFFQPYLFARVGYKWIRFNGQAGFNLPLIYSPKLFRCQLMYISLGASLNLNGFRE